MGISVGGGHPQRRNHHRIIAPVRSLENLPGIGEPVLQRKQVATDVRILLTNTMTHDLLGVLEPMDRHWPTRSSPKKVRVNDRLAPHQLAPPGR